MEKNNERIRPLVFGISRGEVQGVDDLIPRHWSFVSKVLLVLPLETFLNSLNLKSEKSKDD
jgi:hypothetical protein